MAQQTERFGRDERIHHLKQSNPQRGIHTAPTTPQEITNFNAFQRSVSKAPSSEPRPLTEEMVNSIPASARLAEALRVQREQVQRAQQRGPMTRHVSDYISDKPVHEVDTRRPTSSDSNKVRQMGLREMEQSYKKLSNEKFGLQMQIIAYENRTMKLLKEVQELERLPSKLEARIKILEAENRRQTQTIQALRHDVQEKEKDFGEAVANIVDLEAKVSTMDRSRARPGTALEVPDRRSSHRGTSTVMSTPRTGRNTTPKTTQFTEPPPLRASSPSPTYRTYRTVSDADTARSSAEELRSPNLSFISLAELSSVYGGDKRPVSAERDQPLPGVTSEGLQLLSSREAAHEHAIYPLHNSQFPEAPGSSNVSAAPPPVVPRHKSQKRQSSYENNTLRQSTPTSNRKPYRLDYSLGGPIFDSFDGHHHPTTTPTGLPPTPDTMKTSASSFHGSYVDTGLEKQSSFRSVNNNNQILQKQSSNRSVQNHSTSRPRRNSLDNESRQRPNSLDTETTTTTDLDASSPFASRRCLPGTPTPSITPTTTTNFESFPENACPQKSYPGLFDSTEQQQPSPQKTKRLSWTAMFNRKSSSSTSSPANTNTPKRAESAAPSPQVPWQKNRRVSVHEWPAALPLARPSTSGTGGSIEERPKQQRRPFLRSRGTVDARQ